MNPSAGSQPHTLRGWWRQDLIDHGQSPGLSTAEAEEITRLRRENRELRRADENLRKTSDFFASEPTRPTTR